jgi:hypothetical protein
MTIIAATSYTSRVLVDGTLAMVIHIEPAQRDAAMQLFGAPGTPMALAALKTPAQKKAEPQEEPEHAKGGIWSQWVGMRCQDAAFQDWLIGEYPETWARAISMFSPSKANAAAEVVRIVCGVTSRAEIDNNEQAKALFDRRIKGPWQLHYTQATG